MNHMASNKVHQDEFIGASAEVVAATAHTYVGLRGRIVDETRNTFVLETARGERRLPKRCVTLRLSTEKGEATIEGRDVISRPEDRVKKFRKRK